MNKDNSFRNSKGDVYYFHMKGILPFFNKERKDSAEIPNKYVIVENKRTGMPLIVLKEIKNKEENICSNCVGNR